MSKKFKYPSPITGIIIVIGIFVVWGYFMLIALGVI